MLEPAPESPEILLKIDGIFEAARFRWNVKLTRRTCGHVRILYAAALWLRASGKGWPDDLREVERRARSCPASPGTR